MKLSARVIAIVIVSVLTMATGMVFPQVASALPATGIVVNEAMSDNGGSLLDEDGDDSDWIELANSTGSSIDLGLAYLTDSAADLTQWQFPAGASIPANGYLVIFASDKNRANAGQQYHTNFKLSSGGEDVLLVDTDGTTVVSTLSLPDLDADRSFGITSGAPARLASPTPNAANSGPAISSVDLTPSGVFQGSQSVSLSQRGDGVAGTIRFTTNGSEPTGSSPTYGGPFNVSSSTVVRAKVFSGGTSGTEGYGTYTEVDGSVANSDLPLVIVETRGVTIPNDPSIESTMTVIDTVNGVASPTGPADYSGPTGIEIRGSSSAGFPKKQYKAELHDASGNDVDADLLGLGSEEDWILYAPGRFDRNMISNPLAQSLAGQLGLTEMSSRFVEVYISDDGGPVNSSDYQGVYMLAESIKIDKERVDIEKLSAGSTDITGGYVISLDRYDDNEHNFQSQAQPTRYFTGGVGVNVVRPKLDKLTSAQQNYIEDYVGDFEAALYGANFANPTTGYRAYIDVPSWIDTHIIRYLSKDPDIGRLSEYFNKDQGGKLKAGPAWDFDRTFESDDWRDDNPIEPWYGQDGIDPLNDGWWGRLFEDQAFRVEYAARWSQLRSSTMSDVSIQATIDGLAGQLNTAYARENARWGSTTGYGSRFGNYAGEISHLKQWLVQRTAFMDETIAEFPAVNLAEGAATTQSSVNFSGASSRAVDGDTNGRYDGDTRLPSPTPSTTHTNFETQPWWQVDLGSVQDIDSIRLWNRSDCCEDRLSNFHVFVSDVPFTSNSVAGIQGQAGVTDIAFPGQAERTESLAVGRTGRYVRVQIAGSGILSLSEVEVLEGVAPPLPMAPTTTVTTPANDEFVPGGVDVNVTGTSTDDVSVVRVRVALVDIATGLFRQPDGSFTSVRYFENVALASPGAASTDWSFPVSLADGRYRAIVKAVDDTGLVESPVRIRFTVETGGSDTAAPVTTLNAPTTPNGAGQVDLSGTTADNVGVTRVQVALVEIASGEFLQADGSFGTTRYFGVANLASPGAATTAWTYPVNVPDGRYRMVAKANDQAGNLELAVRSSFDIVSSPVDTVAPSSASQTGLNQSTGPVTFSGTADDNVGVETVRIWIRSRDNTQLWLQADGSLGTTRHTFFATLANPGAPVTDWSLDASILSAGRLRLIVQAIDTSNNIQSPTLSINLIVS